MSLSDDVLEREEKSPLPLGAVVGFRYLVSAALCTWKPSLPSTRACRGSLQLGPPLGNHRSTDFYSNCHLRPTLSTYPCHSSVSHPVCAPPKARNFGLFFDSVDHCSHFLCPGKGRLLSHVPSVRTLQLSTSAPKFC